MPIFFENAIKTEYYNSRLFYVLLKWFKKRYMMDPVLKAILLKSLRV